MPKRDSHPVYCEIHGGGIASVILQKCPLVWAMVGMLLCLPAWGAPSEDPPRDPVLAVIGPDTIRVSNLDSLLIETHLGMSMEEKTETEFRNLLEKLINDRLILQEAQAIEMDEEPEILDPVREDTRKFAIAHFVRETFSPPDTVYDAEVRDYFERYYWKIELRQITVRHEDTADSLVRAIRAGASMDSLARTRSLDPMAARGGLHNFKYWADVEVPLREASLDLKVGEISAPFAYRGAVSLVRVERRDPVDEEAYPQFAPSIRAYLLSLARQNAYREYIGGLENRASVRTHRGALEAILADSARVLSGGFFDVEEDRIAVEAADGFSISEADLRRTISHMKMENAILPFDSLLQRSLQRKMEDLVLTREVTAGGYLEKPAIRAERRRRMNEALINAYLNEFISSRITFNREEFQEYYEEHKEEYRGPEEINVDVLLVDEEPVAKEIATRLAAGADFGSLKKQHTGSDAASASEPRWVTPGLFSEPIARAIEALEVGGTTEAFDMGGRWGVFKLLDRRPGQVPAIEDLDMPIRRAMFQRKFNTLLDEHLATLKELAGVQRFEENIERYFGEE